MNIHYLRQEANAWVSRFVLLGCVAITAVLVYTAMEAHLLGEKVSIGSYQEEY